MKELREVREARGWSLTQLAERSGVNREGIWRMERGITSPNLSTLERLADALEVSVVDLLPAKDKVPPKRTWTSAEVLVTAG